MKIVFLNEKTKLVAVQSGKGRNKMMDCYIDQPGEEKMYAFTIKFSQNAYDYCKSGIRVNDVLTKKSRDTGIMRLVKHTKLMIPYLAEYYDLQLRAS